MAGEWAEPKAVPESPVEPAVAEEEPYALPGRQAWRALASAVQAPPTAKQDGWQPMADEVVEQRELYFLRPAPEHRGLPEWRELPETVKPAPANRVLPPSQGALARKKGGERARLRV